jgi:hypothetical protein
VSTPRVHGATSQKADLQNTFFIYLILFFFWPGSYRHYPLFPSFKGYLNVNKPENVSQSNITR